MATVPLTTQRSVLPSVQKFPSVDAERLSRKDYTGRALVALGNQVESAGQYLSDALLKLQEEDDKREFRKLDTELSAYIRTSTYGDGTKENPGFLNLQGENAVNGFSPVQESIKKKVADLKKMATNPRVAEMFQTAANEHVGNTFDTFLNHTADERNKANDAVSNARIAEATTNASMNYNNPNIIDSSLAIAQGELTDAGLRNGVPVEATAQKIKDVQSEMLARAVTAATIDNPSYAQKLLAKYSDKIDGFTMSKLKAQIHNEVRQRVNEAYIAEQRADKALAQKQELAANDNIEKIFNGSMTTTDLIKQLNDHTIDRSGFAWNLSIQNSLNDAKRQDVVTDPLEWTQLSVRIQTGDIHDISNGTLEIMSNDNISWSDKKGLVNDLQSALANSPILNRQDVKLALDQINRVVGDNTGFLSQFDEGLKSRWNNAVREFNSKAISDPNQNMDTLAQDIINGYRPKPVTISSLRKPEYWPEGMWGNLTDKATMQNAWAQAFINTQKALAAGEIEPAKAKEEFDRLNAYKEFISRMADVTSTETQ